MANEWTFHIHHIFPSEVYGITDIGTMLTELGFDEQARGNKIALFAFSEAAAKVRALVANGDTFYLDAGFGGSVHPGAETGLSHKAYNDFAIAMLLEIANGTDLLVAQAEVTKLHSFLTEESRSAIPGLGVESNLTSFNTTWADYDPTPADLNQHAADFNHTITDADSPGNSAERPLDVGSLPVPFPPQMRRSRHRTFLDTTASHAATQTGMDLKAGVFERGSTSVPQRTLASG